MRASMQKTTNSVEGSSPTAESSHDPTQLENITTNGEDDAEMSNEDVAFYDPELPICICRQPYDPEDEDGEMVQCDNPRCLVGWYHARCVRLKELPAEDEEWKCKECRHPKFKMPTPKLEQIRWYGDLVSAEDHTMDQKLEAERSRVLKLRERTKMEAHSAGEWLSRWKKAKGDDEVKKGEERKKTQKEGKEKGQKGVRRDSPMDGEDKDQADGDDEMAEVTHDTEKTAPVKPAFKKKGIAQVVKRKAAVPSAAGTKRKAATRTAAADEDTDRPAKRGKKKS